VHKNWFSELIAKEVEGADPHEDRGLSIATVAVTVLAGSCFIAHQAASTGFFTSAFGPAEALLLYGTTLYVVAASVLIIAGRKSLSRDLDLGGLPFSAVAIAWLLAVFPFDFAHLADVLPGSTRFLVQWISNDVAQVLMALALLVQLALAAYSTVLRVAVYRARSGSSPRAARPA
jgi:hypothetical protein